MTNPKVVIEVISKSTEGYDRGDKLKSYVATPSIDQVVFVSQRRVDVELYTRTADGSFTYRSFGAGGTAVLSAVNASLSVDELYEGAFEIPGDDEEPPPPPEAS